ncbi:secreted protein [Colletotrichum tofieldiae]|nr:secreted protein [Colletotrichum tofieldiae]
MDTTQERERHTTNSIAEQELFFPQSSGSHNQGQPQSGQQSQPRWYDNVNNDSPIEPRSGVPAVNIIPATPTTIRSNSVRSNASYPEYVEHKQQMPGALPEVTEEDNIYDPPSIKSPSPALVEPKGPVHYTASSFDEQDKSKVDDEYYVSPMTEPAVLHHDTGFNQPNGQPSSFDKGKAAETYSEEYYDAAYSHDDDQPSSFAHGKAVEPHPEPAALRHHTEHSDYNDLPSTFDKGKAAEEHPKQDVLHQKTEDSDYNDRPTSFEKGKATEAHQDYEERPALPGPRPVSTEVPDYYAQERGVMAQIPQFRSKRIEEEETQAPPLPQRPTQPAWSSNGPLSSNPFSSPEDQDFAFAQRLQAEESGQAPPLPARPHPKAVAELLGQNPMSPPFSRTPSVEGIAPPPKRQGSDFGNDDPSHPIHYARDPHKLITYLAPSDAIPTRFLIYTPPPPPLQAPPEGVKEGVTHKVQRKWQNEVRQAKMSEAKTTSWAGFKAKCTRGVDKAMQYTTTSNLDYLARLSIKGKGKKDKKDKIAEVNENDSKEKEVDEKKGEASESKEDTEKLLSDEKKSHEWKDLDEKAREEKLAEEQGDRDEEDYFKSKERDEHDDLLEDDPAHTSHETKKTVGVEEIVFVYSPSMNMTPEAMREEFINSMMRTKSKAQRDAIIATGLLPVSLAIDTVMIAVSGLFEVNAVWAYFTIRGSKTARSVTKRLASSSKKPESIDPEKSEAEMAKEDKLKLSFRPATRIDVLARYLEAECHRVDSKLFPRYTSSPTEVECLEAIGWSPALTRGQKNWEDEAWEVNDVKDDLRVVMHKAAKEWRKWCNRYEKNPEKSLNK